MSYTTVAAPLKLSGPSLLSEVVTTVTVAPAEKGNGITIARSDVKAPCVHATVQHLVAAREVRTTSLLLQSGPPPIMVHTVEHLLAALYGMGVTDAEVTVSGENIPILDGSAGPIVAAMKEVGIVSDGAKPQVFTIDEPILVQDEKDQSVQIEIKPRTSQGCRFRYDFFSQRPVPQADGTFRIIEQSCIWEGDLFTFERELAAARTFSFKVEAEAFAQAGLFKHFTPKDLLVIDDVTGHPIQNMYRYKNELARHKLLDLIGDLALVGRRLQVDIAAKKTGHATNHAAARALWKLLAK